MSYVETGARPFPHETPNMVHPAQDGSLSAAEREHSRALSHTHAAGINFALQHGDETAIRQGVPPNIRYRAIMHAAKHRTAMSAAHYMAIVKATDAEAEVAARQFADDLCALILDQLPNSRETVAEIEERQ